MTAEALDRADWYCDHCGTVLFGDSHQVTLDHRIWVLCSTCYERGQDAYARMVDRDA